MSFPSLQSIKRKDDAEEVKVQIQFIVYGTRASKDKSGAYLFLPDGKAKVCPPPRSSPRSHLAASQRALMLFPCARLSVHGVAALWAPTLHLFLHYNKEAADVWRSVASSVSAHCLSLPLTPLPLLFLAAVLSEGAPRGASDRGASLLRGGGALSAFPADNTYPQCAR